MKLLISFMFLFFCLNLNAETMALFASDDSSVKIIVQGADSDAMNLYNSLKVGPEETENTYTKKTKVNSSSGPVGPLIFDVQCTISKRSANLSSCAIGLDSSYLWTLINSEFKTASVVPNNDIDSYRSYKNFIIPEDSDVIFSSLNNKLKISVERDRIGDIFRFRLEYSRTY